MRVGIREATRVDAEIRARLRVGKPAEIHADMPGRSRVVTNLCRSRASTGVRIGARRIAGQEVSTAQKALRTAETRAQPVGTAVRIVRTTLRTAETRARTVGTLLRPTWTARSVVAATRGPLASRAARQATSPSRRTVLKSDTHTV